MMMKNKLNKHYWEKRYANNKTGWNIGYISTPLKVYFDQITDKSLKILIPGAGNSYEAEYLWKNGFKNVFVADFAKQPLDNIKNRVPDFPQSQLLNIDFFDLEDTFDLIFEQTFFCALNPSLRKNMLNTCIILLKPKGKISWTTF